MMSRLHILALSAIFFASPVFAAGDCDCPKNSAWELSARKDYRDLYSECLTKYGFTNNESVMNCSDEVREKAEAEMEILYGQFLSYLTAEDEKYAESSKDGFSDAQEAWEIYRDNHCSSMGMLYMPQVSFCPMLLTIDRVSELRELCLNHCS